MKARKIQGRCPLRLSFEPIPEIVWSERGMEQAMSQPGGLSKALKLFNSSKCALPSDYPFLLQLTLSGNLSNSF